MENEECRYYQPRFRRWIQSEKWDSIAEKMPEVCMGIVTQVMRAEKDGDCSWIVWKNCDYVLDRIRSIAKTI